VIGLGHREHPHDGVVGERQFGREIAMAARRGVHDAAAAADGDVPSRELVLLDVSLEVAIDALESFRSEPGVGWVDFDFQCGHRPSMPHRSHHRRADRRRPTLTS
jgi:hypothetical protein